MIVTGYCSGRFLRSATKPISDWELLRWDVSISSMFLQCCSDSISGESIYMFLVYHSYCTPNRTISLILVCVSVQKYSWGWNLCLTVSKSSGMDSWLYFLGTPFFISPFGSSDDFSTDQRFHREYSFLCLYLTAKMLKVHCCCCVYQLTGLSGI